MQSAIRQQVNVGCLPRDENRRTLRQNQYSRDKIDRARDPRDIGESDQRIVERMLFGVGLLLNRWVALDRLSPHHVIIHDQVIEAHCLDGPSKSVERGWVTSE